MNVPVSGVSQSAEGSHYGGSCHCAAGHGYPDPSCTSPHGGWASDAHSLDPQDYRRGGPHCATAGPYTTPHCAAFQGMIQLKLYTMNMNLFLYPSRNRQSTCCHPWWHCACLWSGLLPCQASPCAAHDQCYAETRFHPQCHYRAEEAGCGPGWGGHQMGASADQRSAGQMHLILRLISIKVFEFPS